MSPAARRRTATLLLSLAALLHPAQAFIATSGVVTAGRTTAGWPTASIVNRETAPTTAAILGYSALGCYSDAGHFQGSRVVSSLAYSGSVVQPAVCAVWCSAAGFNVFGVENSSQCFCDSSVARGAPSATDTKSCSAACRGNTAIICGGDDYINIYSLTSSLAGPVTVTLTLNPAIQSGTSLTTAATATAAGGRPGRPASATAAASSDEISAGAIAGVAVGCLLGGVLLCVLMFALLRCVRPPRRREVGLKVKRRLSKDPEAGPMAQRYDASSGVLNELAGVPYR